MSDLSKVQKFVNYEFFNYKYPRFVLLHMILDPDLVKDFAPHMEQHELWCTYNGERHRVVGVDGDSLILVDDIKADFDELSDWGPDADTVLPKREPKEKT